MTEKKDSPVALVTGAGQRIGNVVVRALADAGYRVVLHVNRSRESAEATAAEIRENGGAAIVVAADLCDEVETQAMIDQAHEKFGRLDALVNSAAIWQPTPLEQTTAAQVREHFEINTLGTWVCCQHAGLIMASQPTGGSIVNLGDWAIARPYLNYSAYFPSKGSIPALTRNFAIELAARNPQVRVNAVLPGPVLLPDDMPAAERQATIDATLVRREGRPENVAHAVLFLLQNDFVTGVCLPVDGGRSIYAPPAGGGERQAIE